MLTPDDAAALPGPSWLAERRRAAAEAAGALALPSGEEEVWRYSRIDELDPDTFPLAGPPAPGEVPPGAADVLRAIGDDVVAVVVVDGVVVDVRGQVPPGLTVTRAAELDEPADALGAGGEPADVFARWNDAAAPDPVVVQVRAGTTVGVPIVVVDWLRASGVTALARLSVAVGPDADATVVWWQGGGSDEPTLALPVIEAHVAPAGRLRLVGVQDRGPGVWQITNQLTRVERDATLTSTQAALGGDYARARVDCRLVGRGATGNLSAVYFGERDQMIDLRTFQDHGAPDTTSNLLFKGAVAGTSRAVYSGLIRVEKDARGTNAFQTNRNLKLSEGAWAESVPNLEIENNDVRCSHASTVGPIDPDQAFYLESRGVPPQVAERLVVNGFFDEVVAEIPVAGVAAAVRERLAERLARTGGDPAPTSATEDR